MNLQFTVNNCNISQIFLITKIGNIDKILTYMIYLFYKKTVNFPCK